ncbi:MAG: PEP-CTERM sorting domain-containing protein [Aliivibrio sp.]|uniref:PEP-CTERM sorting domain-containing protein n=1 Tax=Aliivibrio sp. TaxID=1872443 RepID=UPI001A49FA70|nr:PEP-CTERM sorting domain-containing protein [Aliivibrio sp.]
MRTILFILLSLSIGAANATIITTGNVTTTGSTYSISNGNSSISDVDIETFAGLSEGSLDAFSTGDATEGAALTTTFDLFDSDTLSFDWLWGTVESAADWPDYNDFAFVSFGLAGSGNLYLLADILTTGGTDGTFSWLVDTSGTYVLTIGVLDVGDTSFDSTLRVGNIAIDVPEPTSLAILGLGLLGLGFSSRKKSK